MAEKYNSPKPTHEHVELSNTTPAIQRLLNSGVSRGTIEAAEELQLREKEVGMLQALRFEWRIVLCCLVYLGAALGQGKLFQRGSVGARSSRSPPSLAGLDNGVGNITNAMPGFLVAFGEFDPVTQSLIIPSVWLSLWTAMTALGEFELLLLHFPPQRPASSTSADLISLFPFPPPSPCSSAQSPHDLSSPRDLFHVPLPSPLPTSNRKRHR